MDRVERSYYTSIILICVGLALFAEVVSFTFNSYLPMIPMVIVTFLILVIIVIGMWRVWVIAKKWADYHRDQRARTV